MKKTEICRSHIKAGLDIESDNKDLQTLLSAVEALEKKMRDDEEKRQREEAERVQVGRELLLQLRGLGFRLGPPLYDRPRAYNDQVRIDAATSDVHWPVLFLYPQYSQSDFIASFNDQHSFAAHLEEMFPPSSAAPPWDTKGEYVNGKIEIYFLANAVLEAKSGAAKGAKRWVKVAPHVTLRKALLHKEHVIPGFPVFHLLVPGEFRESFLSQVD